MAKTTHTHRGHCQACGRLQAVDNASGLLAVHGYTVKFGYFSGDCFGSRNLPLEVSRALTDSTVIGLRKFAADMEAEAAAYEDGTKAPSQARTDRCETYRDAAGHSRVRTVMVDWADATEYQRADTIRGLVWECQQRARGARSAATDLLALAERVHGTPLAPVAAASKPAVLPGAVVRLGGKDGYDATVVRIEDRVARGIGPRSNGRWMPHAIFERDGKEWAYPVRLIRNVVKAAP